MIVATLEHLVLRFAVLIQVILLLYSLVVRIGICLGLIISVLSSWSYKTSNLKPSQDVL